MTHYDNVILQKLAAIMMSVLSITEPVSMFCWMVEYGKQKNTTQLDHIGLHVVLSSLREFNRWLLPEMGRWNGMEISGLTFLGTMQLWQKTFLNVLVAGTSI